MAKFIRKTDEQNKSFLVRGDTGIGKSVVVKEEAKRVAENEGRDFVVWNDLDKEERKEFCRGEVDLSEKFLYIDKRFAESDPTDTKGIPDLDGDEFTVWQVPMWVVACTNEETRGYLFLDEFNQAPNLVQASFYNLVLDREISGRSLSDGIHVLGAGNRVEDSSAVNEMPDPLKDRFVTVTLNPPQANPDTDDSDWLDWAVENDIDSRIVSFLSSEVGRDQIHRHYQEGTDEGLNESIFPTPRSWEMASDLIEDIERDYESLRMFVSSCVGKTAAQRFKTYVEELHNQDVKKYIEDPSKASEINQGLSLDEQYKIVTALGRKIAESPVEIEGEEYSQDEVLTSIVEVGFQLKTAELNIMLLKVAKLNYNSSISEDETDFTQYMSETCSEELLQQFDDRLKKFLL